MWESEPGQEDLTALATGVPPAGEVGVGGGEVVHSSCCAQVSEMTRLESHRKEKACTEERKGMHGVKGDSEIVCVPSTLRPGISSSFVKIAK